ncbi:MAG TPA: homogentisate 1,2-dioxygenase [Anaerolineaceae bacterium]|nr:homogentisate 1,2-dioxygenase [Anaerolineaceae bacterium]
MPYYFKLGQIPHKRHTQFRKPDGGLYREEVMGLEGFSGLESILYHYFLPPRVLRVEDIGPARVEYCDYGPIRHRAFQTTGMKPGGDPVSAREVLLGNPDVTLGISMAGRSMEYYYRNAQAYEVWFTHEGGGTLETQFGSLEFHQGDYLVIPFGTTWRMQLGEPCRFYVIEAPSQIEPPTRYRNKYGQLLEHSPYSERDIRPPERLTTFTERGEFEVRVKARDRMTRHVLDHHPLDVVGWDGYLYPWAFSIYDYEPITGRVHQPPPVHQTFQGNNFVVCSFVPRRLDYHPQGIPAPYSHSNINSDEVMYYCEGNYSSRKGINQYDITLHPSGLPHGPQPGVTEASIGKETTDEVVVMVDTFRPLQVTRAAEDLEKEYMNSWLDGNGE